MLMTRTIYDMIGRSPEWIKQINRGNWEIMSHYRRFKRLDIGLSQTFWGQTLSISEGKYLTSRNFERNCLSRQILKSNLKTIQALNVRVNFK